MLNRIIRRLVTEGRLWLPVTQKNIAQDVVVSLTSYPARLPQLHLVIRSLLHQNLAPREIVLYLGNDTRDEDIPSSLRELEKYNFTIKTGYEDLKPHKKYFFAMEEYPDDAVITIDDDVIYDKDFVQDLYNCYKKYPGCVASRRVHRMIQDTLGNIKSYNDWQWECTQILEPSHQLFSTGCGGALYPPKVLPPETFDAAAIKAHCLNTDDVWLKIMELKADEKVVVTNSKVIHPLTVRNTQASALMHTNTAGENRNDINIRAMEDFTGIKLGDFC
ncbi:MAG: glycosyltransferase family 2 protein [Spirochaetaceae bacterium]|nr:glycosyltransferase family 2 protein [Spirochaetaceae bacterium]